MIRNKPWHQHKEGGYSSGEIFQEALDFRFIKEVERDMEQAAAGWVKEKARGNPLTEQDIEDLIDRLTISKDLEQRQKLLFGRRLYFLRDLLGKTLNRLLTEEENRILETKLNEKGYG